MTAHDDELVRVCVLHDPATGEIQHVHTLVLLPDEDVSEEEVTTRAFAGAHSLRPREMGHLRALHVRPDALPGRHIHRVDVTTGTIVSEPITRMHRAD